MHVTPFIGPLSFGGHQGGFQFWVTMNNAAINTFIHFFFWLDIFTNFSWTYARSEIPGPAIQSWVVVAEIIWPKKVKNIQYHLVNENLSCGRHCSQQYGDVSWIRKQTNILCSWSWHPYVLIISWIDNQTSTWFPGYLLVRVFYFVSENLSSGNPSCGKQSG